MVALGCQVHFEAECIGDALPAPEMQGRGHGVADGERFFVPRAMHAGPSDEHQQPRAGAVIGCRTRVLCGAGCVECMWPACAGKGRG